MTYLCPLCLEERDKQEHQGEDDWCSKNPRECLNSAYLDSCQFVLVSKGFHYI